MSDDILGSTMATVTFDLPLSSPFENHPSPENNVAQRVNEQLPQKVIKWHASSAKSLREDRIYVKLNYPNN